MALRLPGQITTDRVGAATGFQPIEAEILGEMASSLGVAGRKAEEALEALKGAESVDREARLKAAVKAVHAYFIQRELCGVRRHDDVIQEMSIPRAVLVRLGAL